MNNGQSVDANAGDAELEDAAADLHEYYSDSTSNVDEQQKTEFEL